MDNTKKFLVTLQIELPARFTTEQVQEYFTQAFVTTELQVINNGKVINVIDLSV